MKTRTLAHLLAFGALCGVQVPIALPADPPSMKTPDLTVPRQRGPAPDVHVLAAPSPKAAVVDQPNPLRDSAVAKVYKIAPRAFNPEAAAGFLKILGMKPKDRKPESTAVNFLYREDKGAVFTYEQRISEFAYGNDSVAFLDTKDHVPDSLIRRRTDEILKGIFGEKSLQYAFVNFEKTMVTRRDEKQAESAPMPAYYIGRYVRKLGGRHILGDEFQVRVSYGAGGRVNYLSYRDPLLTDSSNTMKMPTREMVDAYLHEWARDPRRLGRQVYPYHPDKLRVRGLKPVKIFDSYVLEQDKEGRRLLPRITVLAEVSLSIPTKPLSAPAPPGPVLLHFHFPCTQSVGLCWPDGKQAMDLSRG